MEGIMTTEDEFDDLNTNDKISFADFIGRSSHESPIRDKT